MANSTIPGLAAVTVPALTDLLGVRQSGDTRDKKLTVTQLLSLAPGGGDVTKVGTPVNDQLAVWTGDGTLEGNANFNVVSNAFRSTLGNGPSILNVSSTSGTVPSLIPRQGDPNTGVSNAGDDRIALTAGGVMAIRAIEAASAITSIDLFGPTIVTGSVRVTDAAGPVMLNEAVTGTNPTLIPNRADDDTGIGWTSADRLSIVAGGAEIARFVEDGAGNNQLIIPQVGNNPALPSLAWGDGDTGFFENPDDTLNISLGGVQQWFLAGGLIGSLSGNGAGIRNETASATNPTVNARRSDDNTGLGSAALDQLDLIAGGVSCMAVRETGGARQVGFYTTAPVSLQTGVAVTAGGIHAALVALGLITA